MSAPARVGSCWYRPENTRRINVQIAAQRWIVELIESGRIHHGQRVLLEELAKNVDAKATTQKSIAFLAKRCAVTERTIQVWLRGLAPSKALDPDGWKDRIVTRRFIHAAPEPGKKADNVPSWFTLEIPDRFYAPAPPKTKPFQRPTAPPPRPAPRPIPGSPGGVEKITQAVILGSETTELSATFHPSTNLGRKRPPPPKPPDPAPAAVARPETAPPPLGPPSGGPPLAPERAELVLLAAELFPSHAPVAHKAVERLAAVGLTSEQIARTLRRSARDRGVANSAHPLLTAVWRVEHALRTVPRPKPATSVPEAPVPPPGRKPRDPEDRARLERIALETERLSHLPPQAGRVSRPGKDSGGSGPGEPEEES